MDKHRHTKGATTQRDRILNCLRENAGSWVSLGLLTRTSKAYNVSGRMSELRADGFNIQNRRTYKRGVCHSLYRLA
jgi:hypothetical protein